MINFKQDKDKELFFGLNPILIMILADLSWYAKYQHGIELTVTQTISTEAEDKKYNRVSKAHQQCRAIDIRTKDIDAFIVSDLIEYINNKKEYKKYHYHSNSGAKRLAYYHVGTAEHLHLSIHSQYAIK